MGHRSNIRTQDRGFYYAASADDNTLDGRSIELPKKTIQAALDGAAALIPTPSTSNIAFVREGQGGVYAENLTLYESVLFEAPQTTIVISGPIGIQAASFTSFRPQTIVCNTDNCTAVQSDGLNSFGCSLSALVVSGNDSKGIEIIGSNVDTFYTVSQLRLSGTDSIGIDVTGESGTPLDFNLNTVSFGGEDEIFFNFNPSDPATTADLNVSTIFKAMTNPSGAKAVVMDGGIVKARMGSISADVVADVSNGIFTLSCNAIGGATISRSGGSVVYDTVGVIFGDIETIGTGTAQIRSSIIVGAATNANEMSIKCDQFAGDIINNGTMFVIIGNHVGTLTNNGTINGIINGIRYGNWIVPKDIKCEFSEMSQSTASTTYVDVVGAEITAGDLGESGTYTMSFSVIVSASLNNTTISFQMLNDGVPLGLERTIEVRVKDIDLGYTFTGCIEDVNAGDVIKAQYKTSAGTATISEFSIIADGVPSRRIV